MGRRIRVGVEELDRLLGGGIEVGELTFVYGEEKSGKTSLGLSICASAIADGMRAAYVDCSGRLHPGRVIQVLEAWSADLSKLAVLSIESFLQQEETIIRFYDRPQPFGAVVFDDFTYQHRIELEGEVRRDVSVYRRLAFQVAALKEAASKMGAAIVVMGQVHEAPETGEQRAVAQRILSHWAGWVLRLRVGGRWREMFVEKPERAGPARFSIGVRGVEPYSEV